MKDLLRKIFAPILNLFEKGDEEYIYKPSHRSILMVMGVLFGALSFGALSVSLAMSMYGGILPGIVFGTVGFVCLVVGFLGTDQAVARIWKTR